MKIALISSNKATSPYPVYPLGMSMVAAALRDAGHEVLTLDLLYQSQQEALAVIATENPRLIGISVRNIDNVNLLNEKRYIPDVTALVAALREVSDAKILLGGAGFSILPERILQETGADYGIVGEGERLVVEFAASAEAGRFPETRCIRSEALMDGGSIRSAWYQPELMEFYRESGSLAGIQSKRGCIHRCVYCTYPSLEGHRLRPRNPGDVVDEIEALISDFGAPQFHFTDSVFNDDEGHYRAVVEELARRDLNTPWTAFFKPGNLDAETVALMKRTGLQAAELGTDASTNTTLGRLGKSFTWAEVEATNNLLLDHGISVAHYIMFGGPGETRETVGEGIANIRSLRKSPVFVFLGIRILPGTPLLDLALRERVIAPDHDLITPVYYISPAVGRDWLHGTLEEAFRAINRIVYPPDSFEGTIRMLKRMGNHSGPLWELLMREPVRRQRPKRQPTGEQTPTS
ncbi:MAG: lipid biosynthesis B12-binding/radical SAM protein [Terrimicrobiaceae bacterium]